MFGRNGPLGVPVQKLVVLVFKQRRDLQNNKQEMVESNVMETLKISNFVNLKIASVCSILVN